MGIDRTSFYVSLSDFGCHRRAHPVVKILARAALKGVILFLGGLVNSGSHVLAVNNEVCASGAKPSAGRQCLKSGA